MFNIAYKSIFKDQFETALIVLHLVQRIYWLTPGWYETFTKQFPHLNIFAF